MPRTATIPIPPEKRSAFFVAVWDLACVGYFYRESLDSDPFFAKFGRGGQIARRHGLTILWMVAGAFRFNELAKLRMSDIDWQGCSIHVKRSKNGDSPFRAIDESVIEATLAWRQRFQVDSDLLLPSQHGTPLNVNVFNRDVMNPLGRMFGLRLSSHSLRDTAAQELLKAAQREGLGIKAVQESMGHKNLGSTETYIAKQKARSIALDLQSIGADE